MSIVKCSSLYMFQNIITIKDVMRVTGLGRPSVHPHINRGNLKAERIGGYMWAITPESLATFMRARAEGKYTRQWRSVKAATVI